MIFFVAPHYIKKNVLRLKRNLQNKQIMNFKLISLIVVIALSILLFFFISYSEFTEGMQSLVTGVPGASTTKTLADGITKAMETIDQIVK